MRSTKAISKLQTILIIDLLVVAFAAGGYFYVQSLPAPPPPVLSEAQIQYVELQVNPPQVLPDQPINVTVNATNVGDVSGIFSVNMSLDGSENQHQTIELASGETNTVNFTVSEPSEGTHIVGVGNLQASFVVIKTIELSNLAVNRTEASVGEPIGISITVKNRSNQTSNYSLSLMINDKVIQTKSGQVEGASSSNVLFEVTEQDEGVYNVQIGGLNGTFTVTEAAPPPKPAEFVVTDLKVDPEITEPGQPVNVTAKISNVGESSGTYSIDFSVNGATKSTKTGQLTGGETAILAFTATGDNKGNYTVKVGNLTGTFNVQAPSTIKLTNIIVRPYEVWAGDTVTVTAKGTNQGSEESSLLLKLNIDDTTVETKTLTLAGGADGSIDFTITAQPLEAGDSLTHIVDVNGIQGGFMVVKNGYHTLNVEISPRGDADFDITYPNGVTEQHTTFWSALLPEGQYTITMPAADPTGRITFLQWEDGSTSLSHTITLNSRTTVTATYTGGSSCPSLFTWNGTDYVYASEISNHGWLGYINYMTDDPDWPIVYYRNNPWDYIPLNSSQLSPSNGYLNVTLQQRWNEVFYIDSAQLVVVDHPANTSVYSTMEEQYLDPNYMGNIYTVSNNPLTPVSATNEKGQNILPQISKIDGVFTTGSNGIQSPDWNNITWNRLTLNLGDLSNASQIKLVIRAIVDWGSGDDYNAWLDKFFAQPVPNGTEITPPPYMEVKDANGNWVRVPQSRDFPLPPDGVARTYVVDLTGLFPTNDYSLRISNFWNVTFDYIGVDISPQQNITVQKVEPQAYLYQAFSPGTAAANGNFTKYGNVTELMISPDDMFVIGRQGDAVALQFRIDNLPPPEPGMVRDYFLNESCWFKDETGNWGFGFGFTSDPLPFQNMSGFPYPPDESYPNDTAHNNYLQNWNTREIDLPASQGDNSGQNGMVIMAVPLLAFATVATYAFYKARFLTSKFPMKKRVLRNVSAA